MSLGFKEFCTGIDFNRLNEFIIMGELALDGTLRPIKGVLSIAMQARREQFKGFIFRFSIGCHLIETYRHNLDMQVDSVQQRSAYAV